MLTETLDGQLSQRVIRWVVSCKDKAKSGASIAESDLPSIPNKLTQYKADGFLLVTTTTVGSAAKQVLDGHDSRIGGEYHIGVWTSAELTSMLLNTSNRDLLKQFFPESFRRVEGLTSIEGALLRFQDQIPGEVLDDVMRLLRPYSDTPLKGDIVWPYDAESAAVIDAIVRHLLIEDDPIAAADMVKEPIEYDAFLALLNQLQAGYGDECFELLDAVITRNADPGVRLNAFQFLTENTEVHPVDQIRLASHLDSEGLQIVYSSEIAGYVEETLTVEAGEFSLYDDLNELSSATTIDSIWITEVHFEPSSASSISFRGKMSVVSSLSFEREHMGNISLPGEFEGHFDAFGTYLDAASIDTSSYFDGDNPEQL